MSRLRETERGQRRRGVPCGRPFPSRSQPTNLRNNLRRKPLRKRVVVEVQNLKLHLADPDLRELPELLHHLVRAADELAALRAQARAAPRRWGAPRGVGCAPIPRSIVAASGPTGANVIIDLRTVAGSRPTASQCASRMGDALAESIGRSVGRVPLVGVLRGVAERPLRPAPADDEATDAPPPAWAGRRRRAAGSAARRTRRGRGPTSPASAGAPRRDGRAPLRGRRERDAVGVVLRLVPAVAEAQREPPAAQQVRAARPSAPRRRGAER